MTTLDHPGGVTTEMCGATGGILVVRVWRESPTRSGFRARVSTSLDFVAGDGAVQMTADPDAVLRIVEEWLCGLRPEAEAQP